MSTHRYPGGVISAYPVAPSASSAIGVWTLEEALRNKAAGNWPDGSGSDVYFKNTTLLLHGDGTNGAQNNTFVDGSSNNFTITRAGNTTQGSFDPYAGPGNWGNYFNGSSYLTDMTAKAAYLFYNVDATVEFWIYPTTFATQAVIWSMRNNASAVYDNGVSTLATTGYLAWSDGSVWNSSGVAPTLNTWNHVAWTKSSTTVKLWLNGVNVYTYGSAYSPANTNRTLSIAAADDGTLFFTGYISNFRIVKGTAVYATAFTPSASPLVATSNTTLLTCNNNRFSDLSAGNLSLTVSGTPVVSKFSPFSLYQVTPASYSGYFDGTSAYLTVAANAAFTFGTGDFTIECWVYLTGSTASYTIVDMRTAGTSVCILLNFYSGNALNLLVNGSNVITCSGITANAWHHIALTRSGTSSKIFIDGVQSGSTYTDTNNYTSGITTIGRNSVAGGGTQFLPGSISNFRIVKGQALYTSNFTPSTTPLTTTSQGATAANVSLLTCQSTTFIDNSTNAFAITLNGSPQPKTANPFTDTVTGPTAYSTSTYGGSAYYDGNGDYLTIANNAAFNFGTGDFTIEFWLYAASGIAGNARIISNELYTGSGIDISWEPAGNGISWYVGSTGYRTALPPTSTWSHVAFCRSGTTLRAFLNGVLSNTYTGFSSNITSTNALRIGAYTSLTNPLLGYVSNLRLIKGTALYTSPFVPPSAPLTAVTNTQLLLNTTNAGIFDNTTVNDLETGGSAQISTSVVKFGTGSISFNGSNSYLTLSNNSSSNMIFGTGDFTIEAWIYPTSFTGQTNLNMIIDFRPLSTNGAYVCFYLALTTGYPILTVSSTNVITGTTAPTLNAWNHIALTRSGTSTRVFINGNQTGSTYTDSTNYLGSVGRPIIGATGFFSPADYFTGYMDEIRITKGVARYTSNFTVPVAPFSNT